MRCVQCDSRPAKRACPALRTRICATCCATGRQITIRCPDGCTYLQSARRHPPSAERRQVLADQAVIEPMVRGLTPFQDTFLSLVVAVIAGHVPDPLAGLDDLDVIDAVETLAATHETALRGVIYEHRAERPGARRLAAEIRTAVTAAEAQGRRVVTGEAVAVLRRVAEAARAAGRQSGGAPRAFVDLLHRVNRGFEAERAGHPLAGDPADVSGPPAPGSGGLIIPGRG